MIDTYWLQYALKIGTVPSRNCVPSWPLGSVHDRWLLAALTTYGVFTHKVLSPFSPSVDFFDRVFVAGNECHFPHNQVYILPLVGLESGIGSKIGIIVLLILLAPVPRLSSPPRGAYGTVASPQQ